MSRKTVCDLCGGEITDHDDRYSLKGTRTSCRISYDMGGGFDFHDKCMSRLRAFMRAYPHLEPDFLEVLQSLET